MQIPYTIWIPALPLIAGVLYFFIRFITLGFKATFFGGSISRSHEPIQLEKQGLLSGRIQVHEVRINMENLVCIEIVKKSPMSYAMHPLMFTESDLQRLVSVLDTFSAEESTE